jgi:hypothetical protein
MTVREPYLCLTCNRVMVLRRNIPSREGRPDITIWGCLDCSEKQEADLAVICDAPTNTTGQVIIFSPRR